MCGRKSDRSKQHFFLFRGRHVRLRSWNWCRHWMVSVLNAGRKERYGPALNPSFRFFDKIAPTFVTILWGTFVNRFAILAIKILNLIFNSAGRVLLAYPTVPVSSASVSCKSQKYWSAGGHLRQNHVHIQRFTLSGQNLNQVLRLITRKCYLNFELKIHCIWQEVSERKVEIQFQKISTKGYVCCKMLCLEY